MVNLLTFIKNTSSNKHGQMRALYKCACGNEKEILVCSVKSGNTSSCGCIHKKQLIEYSTTHGLAHHPLYRTYWGIYSRCYNSKMAAFKYYGGRGVKICDEWRSNPESFIKWAIQNGWQKGYEIDKDIKAKALGVEGLLYSPEWCSIVTRKVNGNAKRNNRIVEYEGETYTFSQLCDAFNVSRATLNRRLADNWTLDDAIKTPLIETQLITFNGVMKTISEWARDCNISPDGLRRRLKMHSIEKALTMPKMLNQFKRMPAEIKYSFGYIN